MEPWYSIRNAAYLDTPALVIYPENVKKNLEILRSFAGEMQRAERLNRGADQLLDFGGLRAIRPDEARLAALCLDQPDGFVAALLVHIADDDFDSLAGEGERGHADALRPRSGDR